MLDYYDGSDVIGDSFRISPSSFSKFMDKPHEWYREQVLKEDASTASTATVLGTIVHFVAEAFVKKYPPESMNLEIAKYLSNFTNNEDVDLNIINANYKPMANLLINEYVSKNMPDRVEEFIYATLGDSVVVGGSVDAVDGDTIVDYKTYSSKTKPKTIPKHYKLQLLLYAWIYSNIDVKIGRIRLVYVSREIDGRYISAKTGKPCGKVHPSTITVLTEVITKDDLNYIESLILMCKDTYVESVKNPRLTYLLYKDPRLKIKGD